MDVQYVIAKSHFHPFSSHHSLVSAVSCSKLLHSTIFNNFKLCFVILSTLIISTKHIKTGSSRVQVLCSSSLNECVCNLNCSECIYKKRFIKCERGATKFWAQLFAFDSHLYVCIESLYVMRNFIEIIYFPGKQFRIDRIFIVLCSP